MHPDIGDKRFFNIQLVSCAQRLLKDFSFSVLSLRDEFKNSVKQILCRVRQAPHAVR